MDKFNDISNKIKYQIVGEPTEDEKKAAANKIWEICKESPEIGNAVMDLLGDDAYQRVMMYKTKDISIKKNQDILADIIRNAAPEDIAEAMMQGEFSLINCDNCPAREYCDSRMNYTGDEDELEEPIPDPDGTFVTCEKVMNEWLKEDAE